MAGAMVPRSSMASSPLTDRKLSSFFTDSLAPSHSFFSRRTSGSSFMPLGVVSRGNSRCSRESRAASQFWDAARGARERLAVRNFSP